RGRHRSRLRSGDGISGIHEQSPGGVKSSGDGERICKMTRSGDVLRNICWAKASFGRARLSAVPNNEANNSTARLKAVPSRPPARQFFLILISLLLTVCIHATAQSPLVLDHNGSTIVLEPYAPNIIRVTLSLQKDQALAAP